MTCLKLRLNILTAPDKRGQEDASNEERLHGRCRSSAPTKAELTSSSQRSLLLLKVAPRNLPLPAQERHSDVSARIQDFRMVPGSFLRESHCVARPTGALISGLSPGTALAVASQTTRLTRVQKQWSHAFTHYPCHKEMPAFEVCETSKVGYPETAIKVMGKSSSRQSRSGQNYSTTEQSCCGRAPRKSILSPQRKVEAVLYAVYAVHALAVA